MKLGKYISEYVVKGYYNLYITEFICQNNQQKSQQRSISNTIKKIQVTIPHVSSLVITETEVKTGIRCYFCSSTWQILKRITARKDIRRQLFLWDFKCILSASFWGNMYKNQSLGNAMPRIYSQKKTFKDESLNRFPAKE